MSRGSYVDTSARRSFAHDGEVVGIACDSTNTLMISAGYHGDIKVSLYFLFQNITLYLTVGFTHMPHKVEYKVCGAEGWGFSWFMRLMVVGQP